MDFLRQQAEFLAEKAQQTVDELGGQVDEAVDQLRDYMYDDADLTSVGKSQPEVHRRYRYNHDTILAPLALLETRDQGFPPEQYPVVAWFLKVVKVAIRIAVNRLAFQKGETSPVEYEKVELDFTNLGLGKMGGLAAKVPDEVISKLAAGTASEEENDKGARELKKVSKALLMQGTRDPLDVLKSVETSIQGTSSGRPTSLDDYKKLFVTLPLPRSSENYADDKIFADQRVAGFNPAVIQAISKVPTNFPVTDGMLADVTVRGDNLATACKEGRLFLADYFQLDAAEMGSFPAGPKYNFAPLALFALPPGKGARHLVPVAIQSGQDPKEYPVHTPFEASLWTRAKNIVQQADMSHHELIGHLAGCHLLMEPFVIATHNELPKNHPIRHLLKPHFEGTLFINFSAHTRLLSSDGQIAKAFAPKIKSCHTIAAAALSQAGYFNNHMLPALLKTRGVLSKDLYYPYRDDALDLWHAINNWVRSYLAAFYHGDVAVQVDSGLQAWAKEIVAEEAGRVHGFGEKDDNGVFVSGKLTTVSYLVEALTMVIFTASAGHATLNFAQSEMTYIPMSPAATYRSMPINIRQASVMPELDHLPPLEMAQLQMEFLTLLSGVRHTRLGQYGEEWAQNDEVRTALSMFQEDLKKVSEAIKERNKTRRPAYSVLLPENIPQSINI